LADDYWAAQIRVLNALAALDIRYQLKDRIPPMILLKRFRRFWMGPEAKESLLKNAYVEAEMALNELVDLRRRGLEPPHKKDIYV
jgi:hypothetical protein